MNPTIAPRSFGSIFDDAASAVGAVASSSVQSIVIESSAFFPIVLQSPLASGPDGAALGSAPLWQRLLRPQITVNTIGGPLVLAPAGPPPAFPYLLAASAVLLGLAAYGAGQLLAPERNGGALKGYRRKRARKRKFAGAVGEEIWINGNRATYTGKTSAAHGVEWHEVRMREGADKNKLRVTHRASSRDARTLQQAADDFKRANRT